MCSRALKGRDPVIVWSQPTFRRLRARLVPVALRRPIVRSLRVVRRATRRAARLDPIVLAPIPYTAEQLEAHTLDFFCWAYRPQPGDTIVDVGAGNGTELLCFSKLVGRLGTVHAIEAHPRAAGVAREMIRQNRLRNATLSEFAAWDSIEILRITDIAPDEGNDEVNTVVDATPSSRTVEVIPRTLDDWSAEMGIQGVHLLKMNIEGAEVRALLGASSLLARTKNVAISCHDFVAEEENGPDIMRTSRRVRQILLESGFELSARDDDPRAFIRGYLYGVRPPSAA